jgi:hypothetical protein
MSPSFDLRFSGSSRAQYGAMLVKTSDAYMEENIRDRISRQYMKRFWRSWLEFARSDAMGRSVKKEDLMLIEGLELTKDFSATAFSSHDRQFRFAFEAGVSNLASLTLGGWKLSAPVPDAGLSRASGSGTSISGASQSDDYSTHSPGLEADLPSVHVEYSVGPVLPAPPSSSIGGPIIEDNPYLGSVRAPADHRQSVFIRRLCYRTRPNRLSRLVAPLQLFAGAGPHELGSGERSTPGASPVPSQEGPDSDSDSEPELVSDLRAQVCYMIIVDFATVPHPFAISFETRWTLSLTMSFGCVTSIDVLAGRYLM